MKIFSTYDKASETYNLPFYQRSTGEALRSFTQAANDESTPICKFAPDFTLFHLGEFDERLGSFIMLEKPTLIEHATNCKQ